jgi:D-alanyl-D-alanine carboxypeptidase
VTEISVLERGRRRRRADRRRVRRRRALRALLGAALAATALLVLMAAQAGGPSISRRLRPAQATVHRARPTPVYATQLAQGSEQAHPRRLTGGLRSGLLFDVRSGRVLWARNPSAVGPIASLTKMMTALVVVAHTRASAKVLITPEAVHFGGSGIGLLPVGRRVPLIALLYGLLLPSGNDAAIALAQHVAGSQAHFVALMNRRAAEMGLSCTHFSNVSGLIDENNFSCPTDLAVLAHAVLEQPLLGRIVATRSAVLPFPIPGGKLYLYSNNPLLLMRYGGANGVKTGYTQASGQCFVGAARRGAAWLGVILVHSANAAEQAQQLLNAGFASLHRR